MNGRTGTIVYAAAVAALYAVLTLAVLPLSSGLVQCRFSEMLCVLPYVLDGAVPGLFVGCFLVNLLTGAPVYDVVFGSLATLLAAVLTRLMRGRLPMWCASIPGIVVNAPVIGAVLVFGYGIRIPYLMAVLYVAAGQTVSCGVLGTILLLAISRFRKGIR